MAIRDYSQTAASNTSISSINIGEGCPPSNINDAIRQALADIRELQAGSTIASAATCNIGAANAEYLAVSGTTAITAFDTVAAGVHRVLKFDGILTLTHNATSLILPGGSSITTAAGDVAGFRSLGSGYWRCEWFSKANGSPISLADASVTSAKIGSGVTISFANGTAGAPSITNTGNTDTGIWFPAADTLAASTGGSERMRIDSSGNVGIGTNNPTCQMEVVTNTTTKIGLRVQNQSTTQFAGGGMAATGPSAAGDQGGASFYYFNTNAGGTTGAMGISQTNYAGDYRKTLVVYDFNNQFWGFSTNNAERMRIDSSGNVGIGTSSPGAKLHVASGAILIDNTQKIQGKDSSGTIRDIITPWSDNIVYIDGYASGIQIRTNYQAINAIKIDGSGNVGIGTTSPGQKLTVAGTIESTSGGVKFPDGTTQTTAASGNAIPAGSVMDYAGSTAPSGWLLCAGQAVSRSTYANLFTAISTTYGAGDGSTTFNLPDLRGRVAVGKDDMNGTAANRITSGGSGINGTTLGASGGTQTHTLTTSEMPAHTHGGVLTSSGGTASMFGSCGSSSSGSTGSTGGGGAHQNTQPSMILNKIIKT